MAIKLIVLREAFAGAGAPEDLANKAIEEFAAAFDAFDRGLSDFAATLETMEGEVTFLTWLIGLNLVMTAAILWRVLAHGF